MKTQNSKNFGAMKFLAAPLLKKKSKNFIGKKAEMPKKWDNAGQLKIQQMAFMLMAVTLFFALAGMFVLIITFSGVKESAKEVREKNAILLAAKLANSPEFSCGNAFGGGKINCIDADKVMMLKEKMMVKYVEFWGVSNIEIRKIYPNNDGKECNAGTYPNCDVIKIEKGIITSEYSNFVSLCRKESDGSKSYDKCEIAKLTVSYDG